MIKIFYKNHKSLYILNYCAILGLQKNTEGKMTCDHQELGDNG